MTRKRQTFRAAHGWPIIGLCLALAGCAIGQSTANGTPTPKVSVYADAFAAAAGKYHVPEPLLLALSYVETHWRSDLQSSTFGVMSLYDTKDHTGTLTQAATLTSATTDALEHDPAQNIAGAAAVLADDAKGAGNDLNGWYSAVARYSGLRYAEPAQWYADYVYATLAAGVSAKADDGETLTLAPQKVQPDHAQLAALNLPPLPAGTKDYPNTDAVFALQNGYAPANRPSDGLDIQYIVVHDTEENYRNTVRLFTDPQTCCTANYVVDGADGAHYPKVSQFVREHDVAYEAGNLWYNQHAIGIEQIGYAGAPGGYYTTAMYDTTAQLAAYLCWRYQIPIDRAHILGHGNVPGPTEATHQAQHYDPGQFFDWPYFMQRVRDFYGQWSNGANPTAPALPANYRNPRGAIRAIAVNTNHAGANDVASWSAQAYINFAPVYVDKDGKPSQSLVLGASDPTTAVDQNTYSQADFVCDNVPTQPVGDPLNPINTSFDLRAKAEDGESYALQNTYADTNGVKWDQFDFSGETGWVRDDQTQDGWGARVTLSHGSTLYGTPSKNTPICPNGGNGYSRAGDTYVAQVSLFSNGETWYSIFYNHREVWVPADEVTLG